MNSPGNLLRRLSYYEYVVLGAMLLSALALQIYWANVWVFGYDEAWNLYYSRIIPFKYSFTELQHNAHPPIHSLLLRPFSYFEYRDIWPRMVSIIPSILTIYFLFLTCRKLNFARPIPYLIVFFLAISHTYINISVSVRAYTLAALFTVVSFYFFIDIVRDVARVNNWRISVFVASSVLAMWTEYVAVFAVASITASLIVLILVGSIPGKEAFQRVLKSWWQVLVLISGTVGVYKYFQWTKMPVEMGHVSDHYLLQGGSVTGFIKSGLASNLNYFTPIDPGEGPWLYLTVFVLALLAGYFLFRYFFIKQDNARSTIVLTLLFLTAILAMAGVFRIYPFGGSMRHQFVLFPFIMLMAAIFADELYGLLKNPWLKATMISILVVGASFLSIEEFSGSPIEEYPSEPFYEEEFTKFKKALKSGQGVYLDSFNHYAFFYLTRDQQWAFRTKIENNVYFFDLQKNGEKLPVLSDKGIWTIPYPPDEEFAKRVARLIEFSKLDEVWIFSMLQIPIQNNELDMQNLHDLFLGSELVMKDWMWFEQGYALLLSPTKNGPQLESHFE
jgi:hypothetical protein